MVFGRHLEWNERASECGSGQAIDKECTTTDRDSMSRITMIIMDSSANHTAFAPSVI